MNPAVVGAGVASRLADVEAVIDRHSSFVHTTASTEVVDDSVLGSSARDFVLRAFSAGSDALNYRVLLHLRTADATRVELCQEFGLSEVAGWERANDLVQAGLVARAIDRDQIGLTATGIEIVDFVEAATEIAEATRAESP